MSGAVMKAVEPAGGETPSSNQQRNGASQPMRVLKGGKGRKDFPVNPLEEIKFGKTMRRHIMELAQVFALVASLVALYILYKNGSLANVGAAITVALGVLFVGRFSPRLMLPVWKLWMGIGWLLELTVSKVILFLMWVTMFCTIGILFKIIGKQVMDLRWRAPVSTYWEDRPEKLHDFQLLARQF